MRLDLAASRSNHTIDRDLSNPTCNLYKSRHLIENFFAKLIVSGDPTRKQYRAIATRYDKRAVNFLGAIYLAAAVIWLN